MAHRIAQLQKKKVVEQQQENNTHSHFATYIHDAHQQTHHPQKGKTTTQWGRPIFPPSNQVKPYQRHLYKKGQFPFPPPQSLYTSRDTEVDPKFLRATTSILNGTVQKTSFPLAVWITPFASEQVCVAQVNAPLRCPRCKGYINPYFQFDGTRKSVTCNLCTLRFGVDQKVDNRCLTSTQIATQSVIDFRVTDKFYMKKRTDVVKIVILVEISMSIMELGIFATVIDSVKSVIQSHQFQQNVRIGVAFYNDQGVGFIRAGDGQNQPNVFLVPQGKGTAGCCPLSQEEFYVDPTKQRDELTNMLDFVQKYADFVWKQSRFNHTANYVFALRCMRDSFEQQAGKILLFSVLDPRSPPCEIRARNQQQFKTPLKPINLQAYEYAKQLLRARIGVDHFYFSKDALISHELSTNHFLSSTTGGKLYNYPHYNSQQRSQHLYYNIFHSLTKPCYYDIDFTCRTSNGLTVTKYGAGDGPRQSRDVSLAVIDSTNSFMVEFIQQEKLEEHNGAFIQFAAMYTTGSGQRRIRVITYKFQVRNQPGAMYQAIDYLTLSNLIVRNCSSKLLKGADPTKTREQAINTIGSIVGQVRGRCPTANVTVGSLAVTKGMSWMFSYLSSMLNSRLFLHCMKLSADGRIMKYLDIQQLSPYFFALKFCPHLYPLTLQIYQVEEGLPVPGDFINEEEQEGEEDNKIAVLPQNLPLTKQSLKEDGIYLSDNGEQLVIFVQPQADQDLKLDLFGTPDLSQIQAQGLPQLQTSHNIRVANIISEIRRRSAQNGGMYQPLSIKTTLKKGPYQQQLSYNLLQDNFDCDYKLFLEQILRAMVIPK